MQLLIFLMTWKHFSFIYMLINDFRIVPLVFCLQHRRYGSLATQRRIPATLLSPLRNLTWRSLISRIRSSLTSGEQFLMRNRVVCSRLRTLPSSFKFHCQMTFFCKCKLFWLLSRSLKGASCMSAFQDYLGDVWVCAMVHDWLFERSSGAPIPLS